MGWIREFLREWGPLMSLVCFVVLFLVSTVVTIVTTEEKRRPLTIAKDIAISIWGAILGTLVVASLALQLIGLCFIVLWTGHQIVQTSQSIDHIIQSIGRTSGDDILVVIIVIIAVLGALSGGAGEIIAIIFVRKR